MSKKFLEWSSELDKASAALGLDRQTRSGIAESLEGEIDGFSVRVFKVTGEGGGPHVSVASNAASNARLEALVSKRRLRGAESRGKDLRIRRTPLGYRGKVVGGDGKEVRVDARKREAVSDFLNRHADALLYAPDNTHLDSAGLLTTRFSTRTSGGGAEDLADKVAVLVALAKRLGGDPASS